MEGWPVIRPEWAAELDTGRTAPGREDKSRSSLVAKGDDGIDVRSTGRGNVGCQQSDHGEHRRRRKQDQRIPGLYSVQQAGQKSGKSQGPSGSDDDTH